MLNDATCKAAPARERAYRLADGGSLFLIVRPSGVKSWEFRWKRDGKVRGIVIGPYDDVGLAKARKARDRYKAMLADGLDPLAQKVLNADEERRRLAELKAERERERAESAAARITFERVAGEWIEAHRAGWSEAHAEQVEQSLRDHVFPKLGARRLDTIGTAEVLQVLDPMLAEGKLETAQRVRQRLNAVFEYAGLRYKIKSDPATLVRREFARRLKLARKARPVENFAAIAPAEAPALLRSLRTYNGPAVRLVRWIMLTASRTREARRATWDEIDRDTAAWSIPAERMKARKPHVVPLSRQALALLDEMPRGRSEFLFPHPRQADRPASENAALVVLAAIGYKERMTGHGFRSLFSTIANESGLWRPDVIEAALAHAERDETRAAYLRSDFFDERRQLMEWWADEIDRLEAGGPVKVRAIRGGKRG